MTSTECGGWRVAAEHRLAQLGIRQAHYFGRAKTRFQLYQAATVANLTQLDAKVGLTGDTDDVGSGDSAFLPRSPMLRSIWALSGSETMVPDFPHVGLTAQCLLLNTGFPARFLGKNSLQCRNLIGSILLD